MLRIAKARLPLIVLMGLFTAVLATLPACNDDEQVNERGTSEAPVFKDISAEEAVAMIKERENDADFIIIDVRTPGEFGREHIRNAVNIDYNGPDFRDEMNGLERQKTYLVYCGSGVRSGDAVETMRELEFVDVYNIGGGMAAISQLEDAPVVSCGCS